jgi:hypothetical protein
MGFLFGFFDNREPVDGEMDLFLSPRSASALLDISNLFLEALERVAIHEVVVGCVCGVVACVDGVPALEEEGMSRGLGERG